MKKQIIKGAVELIEGATKAAPKSKTYKGRKRGRKSAAQRAAKNEAAKASRAKLAANRGPQHRGQKLLKAESAKPKLTLGQKLKREKGKVDTSGLSKEENKERRSLIARVIREARAEGKGKKAPTGTRKQTLTKEGLELVQKGDIDTIVKNPKKYMYEGADAQLVSKDATSEFASRKEMREAFKEMSPGERMDFIQKNITPKMTSRQISDILNQGMAGKQTGLVKEEVIESVASKRGLKLPKRGKLTKAQKIERIRRFLDEGNPESFAKLKELQKKRSLGTKSRGPVGRMGTTTASAKKKKGGKVGTKRRGCGAALRGYGKAMK